MISEWECEQDGFASWDELEDYLKCLQQEEDHTSILRLIDSFEKFVEEAIMTDGTGHFLSSYDGCEVESDNLPEAIRLAVKEHYELDDEEIKEVLGYRRN